LPRQSSQAEPPIFVSSHIETENRCDYAQPGGWRSKKTVAKEPGMFEREVRLNGLMNWYLSDLIKDCDDTELTRPITAGGIRQPGFWRISSWRTTMLCG
jgi:hypothetical protein